MTTSRPPRGHALPEAPAEGDPRRVARWMTRNPRTVKPEESVRHARGVVEELRINQLPVVSNGRVVGIVTDRDLRDAFPSVLDHRHSRPGKSNPSPDDVTVETVMTGNVLTLEPTDTIAEAARLMRKGRIGSVPIVEGGRLVAILTRSDLLDVLVHLEESDEAGR